MNGQWIGEYKGSNNGVITLNMDDLGTHFEGIAYLLDSNGNLPTIACFLSTKSKAKNFKFKVKFINVINPATGNIDTWNNVKSIFHSEIKFPSTAKIEGSWDDKHLKIKWETDIGTHGNTTLLKSKAEKPSEYKPVVTIKNWEQFKNYVTGLKTREFLFRGQSQPWRLRTKYHRTGRANLERFLNEYRIALYKHLSARTKHLFDITIPEQNGSFFNLAQHHGYPTPLLDWTYSPFVSAFFAFREITNSETKLSVHKNKKVRIFVFNQKKWRYDFRQLNQLTSPHPHFSIMEFIAIDNERMVPQQAASGVANIDDIESYLRFMENSKKQNYLEVIELPWKERPKVMRELSIMGITAGSLFPGLDGACEELKERFFEI